jgi:hypothetical protein
MRISRVMLMSSKSPYADGRAGRADMVGIDDAARLAGIASAKLQRMATRKHPRVIAIDHTTLGLRFPRWQFDAQLWPVVQKLGVELQGDGLEMLGWLETPLGALGGRTPRAALEQGELADRVLELASGEGL